MLHQLPRLRVELYYILYIIKWNMTISITKNFHPPNRIVSKKYTKLKKKSHKNAIKGLRCVHSIISVIDNALIVTVMGLSSSGLGVLTTVIAAPAIAIATGTAVGVGLLIIIGGQVSKKLVLKVAKHEKIKTLAEA